MAKSITKGGVTSANGRCVAQLRSLQNIGDIPAMPMAQWTAKRARDYAHVITGYMKEHTVAHKVDDTHAELISTAPYAGYEEFGTRFRPPHPFIRPAIVDARVELPNMTRKQVNAEIRRRVKSA
jgi:HK97 gp10 family phage protein